MDITIQFPTADYAVIVLGDRAIKTFSAEVGGDRTLARATMKAKAFAYAEGLCDGWSEARHALSNSPIIRTKA